MFPFSVKCVVIEGFRNEFKTIFELNLDSKEHL